MHLNFSGFGPIPDVDGVAGNASNGYRGQFPVFPRFIHFKTAPGAQAFDGAGGPRFGKSGKEANIAQLALKEHFGK